jgi:hypothetical protein
VVDLVLYLVLAVRLVVRVALVALVAVQVRM